MAAKSVLDQPFGKIYPFLIAKAQRKGRTREEVDAAACWLTGYTPAQLAALLESDTTYGAFFQQAPAPAPARTQITGVVCGVRVETVSDPIMREARYLDKLVDELARGKPLARVLRGETAPCE